MNVDQLHCIYLKKCVKAGRKVFKALYRQNTIEQTDAVQNTTFKAREQFANFIAVVAACCMIIPMTIMPLDFTAEQGRMPSGAFVSWFETVFRVLAINPHPITTVAHVDNSSVIGARLFDMLSSMTCEPTAHVWGHASNKICKAKQGDVSGRFGAELEELFLSQCMPKVAAAREVTGAGNRAMMTMHVLMETE